MLDKINFKKIIDFNTDFNRCLPGTEIEKLKNMLLTVNEKEGLNLNFELELSEFNYLFLKNPKEVPIPILFWVFCHNLFDKLPLEKDIPEIICFIEKSTPCTNEKLNDLFKLTALQFLALNRRIRWLSLVKHSNLNNWNDIDELSSILPLSDASLDEVMDWLSIIVKIHKGDGALAGLQYSIENWTFLSNTAAEHVTNRLLEIADHPEVNRYLKCFIAGLQLSKANTLNFYIQKLENAIRLDNAFFIFNSLAQIGFHDENERIIYFNFLALKYSKKQILPKDFYLICCMYSFYNEEVYQILEHELFLSEDIDHLISISAYLEQTQEGFDYTRHVSSLKFILSKMHPRITTSQNNLLIAVSENDINLAYEIFELRMQVMGGNEFLEDGLVKTIIKNPNLFQQQFVRWLTLDDHYIHVGLRHICNTQNIPFILFKIPANLFHYLSLKEKHFVAYKVVGYIYSMEPLQQLLISLALSIEKTDEAFTETLHFIFSNYLVYNYRTTLSLLKKEREATDILPFAKDLFNEVIREYDEYFKALRSISKTKDILAYPRHLQLRNFYFNNMLSHLPKQLRENTTARLFKDVIINANKWATRRQNEYRHTPQSLATISFEKEFPSGESLNPVFQEEIRRTYQNIRLNEIRSN